MSVAIGSVTPVPSAEEAAAIAAAVTMMWPQPVSAPAGGRAPTGVSWRFSGRWWASQHVVRRSRPGF